MYKKDFKINKILLAVISSIAITPTTYAAGADAISAENREITSNDWNCQKINSLWSCVSEQANILSQSTKSAFNAQATTVDGNAITAKKTIELSEHSKPPELSENSLPSEQSKPLEQSSEEAFFSARNSELAYSKINSNICFEQTNNSSSASQQNSRKKTSTPPSTPLIDNEITYIEADEAQASNRNQIDFTGNVIITRADSRLISEQASYSKKEQLFMAEGNVEISQPGVWLSGDKGQYQSETKEGQLENSSYVLPQRPAQGKANKLEFKPGHIAMQNPTYSSCPANAQDWVIKASEMNLYTEEGYGDGNGVVVYFKGIPFIYTPYIRFPLNDERSSGFLLPEVGYSSSNGADISTPYYWNIAPNMDATITPRILSKNGLMLGSEFRYLGKNHSGEIYGEYLNDNDYDKERDAVEVIARGKNTSQNRGAFSAQHRVKISQNWKSDIDFNYVSDNYYIDDFGNSLKDRSETHLLRQGKVNYSNSYINFTANVQGYQELKENVNTYTRLPQLLLSGYNKFKPGGIPLGVGFNSEAVMFAKNWEYNKLANEGQRYNIRPYIDMPYKRQYGYIKPKASFDLLQYQLDETALVDARTSHDRALPIFSLDSGLFFEKELSLFDVGMLQTLEPRLFYLYVPYEDQSMQPIFDTSSNSFTFNQLFRENRFSGLDRLGDANQMTYALTSRFIDDKNGFERFRASLGQIVYFQDREVQLNSTTTAETQSTSAIAAEVASQFLPSWNTSLSMLYDPHESIVDTSTFRIQYKSDPYHIVNFDYTYKSDGTISENYEQIDMSAYWKVTAKWRALARWNYSLQDEFNLESMLGIEYDSCCYAIRLVVSREQSYQNEDAEHRIMLQMQFKGLASLGNISDKILRNDIPGFENTMTE